MDSLSEQKKEESEEQKGDMCDLPFNSTVNW
jgi:hypothetical protein